MRADSGVDEAEKTVNSTRRGGREEVCGERSRKRVRRESRSGEEAMVEVTIKEDGQDDNAAAMRDMKRNFEMQRRQARFDSWKADGERMKAAAEAEIREQLERWAERWVVCQLGGEGEVPHEMEACPKQGGATWAAMQGMMAFMEEGVFAKRRLADCSGCVWCRLGQAICERWETVDDDGGRSGWHEETGFSTKGWWWRYTREQRRGT